MTPETPQGKTDYFDFILEARRGGEPWVAALGDFNHWGYWDEPKKARVTLDELEPSMARLTDELLAMANIEDGMTVLDVGFGLGGNLRTIDGRHQNMTLYGLDHDPRLVELVRGQLKGMGSNTIELFEGCATRLPLPDKSVDVVVAVECIFHFPSRETFMAEAARVLKPGGRLVISDYLLANMPPFVRKRQQALAKSYALSWLGDLNFITEVEYGEVAEAAGFETTRCRDVTENTLPTYPSRVRFFKSTGLPGNVIWPRILGMRLAEVSSKAGVFKYALLAFEKGVGA